MNPDAGTLDQVLHDADERRTMLSKLPDRPKRQGLRIAAGLSQRQAAAALGVSQSALHRWEHGTRTPTGPRLRAYLDLLDRFRHEVTTNGSEPG